MSQQSVLVLNCGSSSLKFAVLDAQTAETYLSGLAERLGEPTPSIKWKIHDSKKTEQLDAGAAHKEAIDYLVQIIHDEGLDKNLVAIGHRVVHGGETFTESAVIDAEAKHAIEDMIKLAPLHNPANLMGIEAATHSFPELPQAAVFDTAFHQTMPKHAYLYALPYSLYKEHGIRRYGMHGTSHYFVSREAAKALNKDISETNLISAHLGNGCSIAAIKNGESVDTSMGLTPLEGLVMGTRSGDVDPGLYAYLSNQLGYSAKEVDDLLNKQSGLLGISELSNDCRTLEEEMEAGNPQATLAMEVFCYRLAKYIASYTVPLGRLDGIVFTGGIGENSSYIRENVLNKLAIFGFKVDDQKNLDARFGNQGVITTEDSPIAMVIPTNEEWVIAHDAYTLTQEQK